MRAEKSELNKVWVWVLWYGEDYRAKLEVGNEH